MKIQLTPTKPDPFLEWHEWFAWYPVIAKEAGYYTVSTYKGPEYLVWWRYVMRKRDVANSDIFWKHEVR